MAKGTKSLNYRSLFLFQGDNPIRKKILDLTEHRGFEICIFLLIVVNCILIAIQGPQPSDAEDQLAIFDLLFNVAFLMEIILRVIANGFILHRHSYLRDPWNVFDFLIVILGFPASIASYLGTEILNVKSLRLFRVLRPLRLIAASRDLRVVLDTILASLIPLAHVATFIWLLISLWATIGLELFSGVFHPICFNTTTNQSLSQDIDCNVIPCPNGTQCLARADDVGTAAFSFDNIGVSLLTVFRIFTLDAWNIVLYKTIDAMDSYWVCIYFILFVLIGSYFSTDLLLGILGNEYLKTKSTTKHEKTRKLDLLPDVIKGKMEGLIGKTRKRLQKMRIRSARLNPFQSLLKRIVRSTGCFIVIMTLIFLNTVCLGLEHRGQPKSLELFLENINIAFVVLFTIELMIKLLAYGMYGYFQSKFRTFDFVLVFLGLFEVICSKAFGWQSIGLNVMRCLRLIRLFRLTRFWPTMSAMIQSFTRGIRAICSLIAVLVITMFVYALLGNQLFGYRDDTSDEVDLITFQTLGGSLLNVFVILTEGGWPEMLESWAEAYCPQSPNDCIIIPITFVVTLVVFGGLILMNIFLGIVVDNMTEGLDPGSAQSLYLETGGGASYQASTPIKKETVPKLTINDLDTMSFPRHVKSSFPCMTTDTGSGLLDSTPKFENDSSVRFVDVNYVTGNDLPPWSTSMANARRGSRMQRLASFAQPRLRQMSVWIDPHIMNTVPHHDALFIFTPFNKIRRVCFNIVSSEWFPGICIGAIVLSTLVLALESPLEPDSDMSKILKYVDYGFTGLFIVEILLKSISYGFLFGHPRCMMRDPMNVIDVAVVLLSTINIIMELTGSTVHVHLGMLRFLRVFRALKVFPSVKHVIDCLFASLQNMLSFLFFYVLIMYIYAVIGVKLYRGKMLDCFDKINGYQVDCDGNSTTFTSNLIIKQSRYNFNNIFEALVTLFTISTLDDWSELLEAIVNGVEDTVAQRMIVIVFVVTFVVLTSFIMLNIVVGIVVIAFHKEKKEQGDFQVLSKHAQDCIETALNIKVNTSYKQLTSWRRHVWYIVTSSLFEYISLACIIANLIVLATKHYGQSEPFDQLQEISNLAFTVIFTIEILLKFIGFGPTTFGHDEWCIFDTVVVAGSWVDIALTYLNYEIYINLTAFRIFRALRIVKLVNKDGNLRQLLRTFIKSLRSIPSVALLLCLLFYVYAVIGMQLFGRLSISDGLEGISKYANFQTFPIALLTLLRVTTLDAWKELMMACADTEAPNCYNSETENCGSNLAFPYFISFVFCSSFLITNLFLAVIMENFEYLTHDCSVLDIRHIVNMVDVWNQFDVERKGRVHTSQFAEILRRVAPPLGSGHLCPKRILYRKLLSTRLVIDEDNTIDFQEFLLALVIKALRLHQDNRTIRHDILLIKPNIDSEMLERLLPTNKKYNLKTTMQESFLKMCATIVIQERVKEILNRNEKLSPERLLTEADLSEKNTNEATTSSSENQKNSNKSIELNNTELLENMNDDIALNGSKLRRHRSLTSKQKESYRLRKSSIPNTENISNSQGDWLTDESRRMSDAQQPGMNPRKYSKTVKLRKMPLSDTNNNKNSDADVENRMDKGNPFV